MHGNTFAQHTIAVAAIVLVLGGCGSQPNTEQASTTVQVVKAQVAKVEMTPVEEFYEAPGTVSSNNRMQIASKIMGRIINITCVEGGRVEKGQMLFEVDDQDATARLDTARAELTEAQRELEEAERDVQAAQYAKTATESDLLLSLQMYNRYEELLKRNSVSQQEFDNVSAKHKSASAQVQQAEQVIEAKNARRKRAMAHIERAKAAVRESQVQITFSKIFAPASGIVASKQANVGDIAMPGVPILTLDSERYRLDVPVEESRMPLVHKGAIIPVTIEFLGLRDLPGVVEEIVPAADPATRSSLVKIALPAKEGLHAGIFGRARFSLGVRDEIEISSIAILNRGELTMVYIVDGDGIARLRLVKTGKEAGGRTEILAGLRPGENIVVAKTEQLKDGIRVEM